MGHNLHIFSFSVDTNIVEIYYTHFGNRKLSVAIYYTYNLEVKKSGVKFIRIF